MKIEPYQQYGAVFQPARTDNLKPEMFKYVGREAYSRLFGLSKTASNMPDSGQ